ncbi:LCP family protein [Nocardioides panacisoli]|uniref:LCP family protein n=1 Tax=Nocardioides panacisoli TaxID=627624 RepID=UPI001C639D68|nr:LCP family protein [Nocardioides panacisoli]QYJ04390.1 LCP family protein [Nocardioides panacisoli]
MVDYPGPLRSHPLTDVGDRAARVRFRRALTLMAFTLLAPGSAQLLAGNRRVGRIALRAWLTLLGLGALTLLLVLVHRPLGFWLVSQTTLLLLARLALFAGAIGWAYLFVDAWRIGRPLSLQLPHRRAVIGVNGVLCFSVVGTLLFGAHVVGVQRDFIISVFGDGEASAASAGRYNVLLLGGDAGQSRWGMRPDSIHVASIDAETGRTVLVGLPRNMKNFPFADGSVMDEQFPDGFDADYLNGVSTWAQDHTDLFDDPETAGTDATIMAVEGITGLDINYWASVNLQGFKDLVDAVGGVTLNVRRPIPIGLPSDDFYDHIQPGERELSGFEALWFARARHDSDDYSRMARQKCVLNAFLRQVSPQQALRNFQELTRASAEMVATNVPTSEVDRFLDLALKAKSQKIASVSLVPPAINTGDPDIDKVRARIQAAIDKAEGKAPAPSNSGGGGNGSGGGGNGSGGAGADRSVTGGSVGSLSEGYAANDTDDVAAAC